MGNQMKRAVKNRPLLSIAVFMSAVTTAYPQLLIQGPERVTAGGIAYYSATQCPNMSYIWFVDGGTVVSGAGTPEVTIQWGCDKSSGFINVQGMGVAGISPCGPAVAGQLGVRMNYLGQAPLVIDGPELVCEGSDNTYRVPAYSLAKGYQWTVPTGATIISPPLRQQRGRSVRELVR